MTKTTTQRLPKLDRAQKRALRTRQKLKDAALSVFTEKGVEATTIDDITRTADLGKGTFYRHFADKNEAVFALVEDAIEDLVTRLRSYAGAAGSLEEVLENILQANYDFFIDSKEKFILLFQGRVLLKLQGERLEELEQPYVGYLEEIENEVSPFVSRLIDPIKVRRLACAVAGFVFGFFSFAMIGMDSDEIDASVKPLRKAFVRSLITFLGR